MNGYVEMTAMLLVFCAEKGVNATDEELAAWIEGYWDSRFASLEPELATFVPDIDGWVAGCQCASCQRKRRAN